MTTVFQINMNHCQMAYDLLVQHASKEKAGIVVSEQYNDLSESNWMNGTTGKTAI